MTSKILHDYSFHDFSRSVINGNEHIFADDARSFLDALLETSETKASQFPSNSIVWRAQRSCGWNDDPDNEYAICHPKERMIPDARYVRPGRANLAGKPVFYGSANRDTAVKEMRPWIGCLVSVAKFRTTRTVRLVNLVDAFKGAQFGFLHACGRLRGHQVSDQEAEELAWHWIGEAFCNPVSLDDDPRGYLPTQIIAELFKKAGFGGILYRCAVDGLPPQTLDSGSPNLNVAIFDPSVVEMLDGTVIRIKGVGVTIEEGPFY